LSRHDSPSLYAEVFDVLLVLVENSGHMSGRPLMKKVWCDTFVEEANLR